MPISPSDLPWWGWLLCSIGAFVACGIVWTFFSNGLKSGSFAVRVVALVSATIGLLGVILGGLAIVRFVKWVWVG